MTTPAQKARDESRRLTGSVNWDKVWVITRDGRQAWKLICPACTINFDDFDWTSADTWVARMKSMGYDIIDNRGRLSKCAEVVTL